ncbi:unnamed protein product, partial [Cuscuta epithymum]
MPRRRSIESILGMQCSELPMKYLGIKLHKGINRFQYCDDFIKLFDSKLTPWKCKNLSQGGRLILIKHVLSAIPLHILAADTLPKKVISILERKLANFFWGFSNNRNKHHWLAWSKLCLPTNEGGLGIRTLSSLEKAFSIKLWWKWRK